MFVVIRGEKLKSARRRPFCMTDTGDRKGRPYKELRFHNRLSNREVLSDLSIIAWVLPLEKSYFSRALRAASTLSGRAGMRVMRAPVAL